MIRAPLIVALAVAAAVLASSALSRRTRVPAPCFLVLAGLAVSGTPGIEAIRLPPDVVFFGFLPPLLYAAAFLTAPREVRANWLSILLLAVGLTAATLFAVGGAAWAAVGALGAGGAFVLGAVLGPTDPISATTVIGSSSAPERLRTILEAESLVNDGVGLVAFSIALTAAERGSFSVADGLLKFVQLSIGGIAFGVVLGLVLERIRRHMRDPKIEISVSLLTPYLAYIPAERAHLSGILATVACGVFLGWRSGGIFRPEVRLQSVAVWDVLTFVLSSVLFVLLGTQFRAVLKGLGHYSPWVLARDALLVFGVVTVVRLAWMFTVPHVVAQVGRSRQWAEIDPWQDRFLLGWSGMRGALSLAAALSIPAAVAHREEILFLTFTTILAGLVVLGIPFPWLLARLGFGLEEAVTPAEVRAGVAVTEAALARLAELERDDRVGPGVAGALRGLYESRVERLGARRDADGAGSAADDYVGLRRELLAAERAELARLEREGELGFTAARHLERQLDHEESGLRR
ncbi:MAG: monovalent cation/hydrogen antiporter [Actinomycetota bacterium]